MAGFLLKQVVGNKINEVTGGLNLGSDDNSGEKTLEREDPEVGYFDFIHYFETSFKLPVIPCKSLFHMEIVG